MSGNHRVNVLKALNYNKINVLKDNIHLKPKNLINNHRYNKKKKYNYIIDYDNSEN